MNYSSNTIFTSMIWKLMERFSSQIISFVISIILARLLLPTDYGVIALVLVFINFANVIIDGGLNTALIQNKETDSVDYSTIFWFGIVLSLFCYGIVFLTAPLIASFYKNTLLIDIIRVLALVIIINSVNSIQRAYVSKYMLFKKLFLSNFVSVIISGICGIILAYNGYGVWALVVQQLLNAFSNCIIMWFTVKWRPILSFSKKRFLILFDYGWKIFLTNLIIEVYEDIRSLLIGKIYKPADLAYFDRGKQMPSLVMGNITGAINTVLLPTFSSAQEDIPRLKQMMRRSNKTTYFFVAPFLVWLFFTAKPVVLLLLTEKWIEIVPYIRIFCIAFILLPIQNTNMLSTKSLGCSNITLKLEIIKKIIELIILVVSFTINVKAVAWGIVVYNFVSLFINLSPSGKLVNYSIGSQLKDILPTLMISLFMGLVLFTISFFISNYIILLICQSLCAFVIYLFLCRFFNIDSLPYLRVQIQNLIR